MNEDFKAPLLRPAAELRRSGPRKSACAPRAFAALIALFLLASAALLWPQGEEAPAKTGREAPGAQSAFTQLIPAGAGMPVSAAVDATGDSYVLCAQGDGYALEGDDLPLDKAAAQAVLACGASLLARQRIDSEDDAAFGLDPARVTALFTYADGQTRTLRLGDAPATGAGRYARIDGMPGIYVVNRAVYDTLSAGVGTLAAMPDFSAYQAQTLMRATVTPRDAETVSVRRVTEPNPFNTVAELTEPIRYPASAERAAELFSAVCALEAQAYAGRADSPAALAAYGLDAPLAAISLLGPAGETLEAQMGEANGALYLRLDGGDAVYTLAPGAADFLENARASYLAEQLAGLVSLSEVRTLTLSRGAETHTLAVERPSDGEAVYSVDAAAVDLDAFRPYYQAAIGLLIDRRRGEEEPGACRAAFTYTFTDGGEWTIQFLAYDDLYDAVLRDGEAAFLIARQKVDGVFDLFQRGE